MEDEEVNVDVEADLSRIEHIARKGLERERDGANPTDQDLHLDTFAIVCVWAFTDEDGDECESYSVWSESRRTHVHLGILNSGIMRLKEGFIQHD